MSLVSGTITAGAASTPHRAAHKGNVWLILFKARPSNTGNAYLGGEDVAASDGLTLTPGDAVTMEFAEPISTSQFYAAADNADDAVDFLGVT